MIASIFLLSLIIGVTECFAPLLDLPQVDGRLRSTQFSELGKKKSVFFYSRVSPPLAATGDSQSEDMRKKAESMLAKARQLRSEIDNYSDRVSEKSSSVKDAAAAASSSRKLAAAPWSVVPSNDDSVLAAGVGYRLYVDLGREEGTWMDPRWGASGKRIEFTLDVKFLSAVAADETVANRMVKDNFGGKSSNVFVLESAKAARLRGGFDSMKCLAGGYRIDVSGSNGTARFYVAVEGTPAGKGSNNGDIFVPEGCLYFSLPCFGGKVSQLSTKGGPVAVRQTGWHTGWRREESRIVGSFRAVPILDAQRRDKF